MAAALSLTLVGLMPARAAPPESRGSALVIGNQSYPQSPLGTPTTDEREIAAALQQLQFAVTAVEDADSVKLKSVIDAFVTTLTSPQKPIILYYAGHAVQINGVNYLIPVDASFTSRDSVSTNSVSLNYIFEQIHSASSASLLVILDACRTNPFAEISPTDWVPGLAAPTNAPKNSFIAFATDPGNVAADGVGKHSPYTRAILKYMRTPGLPIEEVFKKVREDVVSNTDGLQTPWENTSLTSTFYLRNPVAISAQLSDVDDDATVLLNGQQVVSWSLDHAAWKSIPLQLGVNSVVVQVYNQRSYTGGIPPFGHQPEGWRYTFNLHLPDGASLVSLHDAEDRPSDNGPRHGKLFIVATFELALSEYSDSVTLQNSDYQAWKH